MHERRYRASQAQARKKDTREKIQLGGLIVKAGLRNEDRAVILGALLDAVARLGDAAERARLKAIGKAMFENDRQEIDAAHRTAHDDDGNSPGAAG